MNPELQEIFDTTPADKTRSSKLEPYRDLILRWRRQGRTYRKICLLLADRCGIIISYLALYEFVQRRSRPRQQIGMEPAKATPTAQPQPKAQPALAEQKAAQFAAKQALLEKSRAQSAEEKPLFAFGWDQQSTRDRKG